MPVYTRSVDYIRFDPATATLTITVTGYSDGNPATTTGEIPCVLPVSPAGSVPSGQDLIDFVEAFAAGIVQPAVIDSGARLAAAGGTVTNAQDVFALTTETESGETPGLEGAGIPVVIFPDRVYTPSGSVYTRSVLASLSSNAVSGGGRFPSAYEQSVLLGNGIIDNGNIYSTPWPPNVVNTTIATIATMTTIDTFTVTNATGITSGMLFFMPTYGVLTVNNVVGTTITTTTQFQVTPNAVPGTALLFREGSFARITSVFDDNFVFGVGSVQDVYTSAFGSGVPGIEPSGAIPAHIQAAYPNIFGGDAMLAAMGNPGFDLNDYLHYIYVEHNPLTITTTTGYGWFQYS